MPGILKTRSFERLKSMRSQHESDIRSVPAPRLSSAIHNMDRKVSYIPTQMDLLSTASTRALQMSPIRLFFQDAAILLQSLRYLPWVFLPFSTKDDKAELSLKGRTLNELLLQALLVVYQTSLLLLLFPALLLLPGGAFVILAGVAILMVKLIALPLQGPGIAYSKMNQNTQALAEKHKGERWIFINGCASSNTGLQANVDRLSLVFGRAVVGIHNKTYGLVADILECLIQRVFSYINTDVRVAYEQVKAVILDPEVTKVVLIAHSQGGIIVSLVLDRLCAELSSATISKLEIYTFGSAASHFSNPRVSFVNLSQGDLDPRDSPRVIPYIEHYANEYDMVPRWGVLHSTQNILSNRYAGSVFVRMGASGHMFNQHYLNTMFHVEPERQHQNGREWIVDPFLDKVVSVDAGTLRRRQSSTMEQAGIVSTMTELQFGDGEQVAGIGRTDASSPVMTFDRTDSGRLFSEEFSGKTVRELSRLWRYQGGKSPDDHVLGNGHGLANGH